MIIDEVGTHVTHCCKRHGCKYGDSDCPVARGELESENRLQCETCWDAVTELRDVLIDNPPGVELLRRDNVREEWVVHTAMGSTPLVFYFNGQVVINTALYGGATLAWIAAKVRLIELLGSL